MLAQTEAAFDTKRCHTVGISWSLYRFSRLCKHAAYTPACLHLISCQHPVNCKLRNNITFDLHSYFVAPAKPLGQQPQSVWLTQALMPEHLVRSQNGNDQDPCRLQEVLPQQMNSTNSTHLIAQLVPK